MGVDLRLLAPMSSDLFGDTQPQRGQYITSTIAVPRNRDMWETIEAAKPQPHPPLLEETMVRDDDGDTFGGEIGHDCYGQPLAWLPGARLAALIREHIGKGEDHRGRLAGIAAWCESFGDCPIVLYWH